ncbi:hypothetical protein OUZ56_003705 [Daphnia magna]|uniref:Uncharacterized protein n=1 Tax=Daphnia magna TaxID=35525 RepID=A0ABR0A9H6_9CRUS|nr:hypothetical protein OUZ56_003705 [Daphnia magna]
MASSSSGAVRTELTGIQDRKSAFSLTRPGRYFIEYLRLANNIDHLLNLLVFDRLQPLQRAMVTDDNEWLVLKVSTGVGYWLVFSVVYLGQNGS